MDAVERLPIPYWLTYLGLFVLESIVFHVLSWVDGWLPAYTVTPILFLFPLWLWAPLAIITHLNSISLEALDGFAPLLNIQEEPLRRLKNEFTTMPNRIVIISGVFWSVIYFIIVYVGFQSFFVTYHIGTLLTGMIVIEGLVSYATGSIIYYHSIRQLRLVNRTVKMVKQFNLFQLDPVYAFSLVTSRTGVSWVILLSLTLLMFPIQLAPIPVLALLIVQIGLAISAFALPLQIVHHRLVLEKRRLRAELNQHVESTLALLHHRLDENDLNKMIELNHAIMGLNTERDILEKISTWPWRAGVLTGFLSIVVLPILLFLVQFALGHWLGK
jgi:hypothetical protein